MGREHNAYQPFRDAINRLTTQARRELIALMWLGREMSSDAIDYFPDMVKRAGPQHATSYLDGKGALLAEYLRNGLRKLK